MCEENNTLSLLSVAPGVAALALSGDWTSEFLSGADAAAAASSGQAGLGDPADADWTREFITDGTGTFFGMSMVGTIANHLFECTLWLRLLAGREIIGILLSFPFSPLSLFSLSLRSRALGRGVSGAVRGEAMARRPGREGARMVIMERPRKTGEQGSRRWIQ